MPGAALATVYVTNGVDVYAAIPAPDGYFLFAGLPEGTYDVTFDADPLLYIDATVKNVDVRYGQVTDLGTTVLTQ